MNVDVYVARRRRLMDRVKEGLLLIPGATPQPLNIPINTVFRQSSHILYLTGCHEPGASLLGDPDTGRWELFVEVPPEGDEIWHGKRPGAAELRDVLGVDEVYDLSQLESRVNALRRGRPLLAMPAPDGDQERLQWKLGARQFRSGRLPREFPHPLADALIDLRMTKDAGEIEELQKAANITREVHIKVMRATRPGQSEAHIRALVTSEFILAGGRPAYDPIVTVRGDILHAKASSNRLEVGQLLLVDVGIEVPSGYCADVTRTLPVSGKFSPEQRDLYQVVWEAQRHAISLTRPGVRYRDLHVATCVKLAEGLVALGILKGNATECVEENAHALFFPHGVGHLLGLDVHDLEDLGDRAGYAPGRTRSPHFGQAWLRLDRDLEPGMVVTIEPGLYFIEALLRDPEQEALFRTRIRWEKARSFLGVGGIRIEDDVWVSPGGPVVLTEGTPRTVAEVEAVMGQGELV